MEVRTTETHFTALLMPSKEPFHLLKADVNLLWCNMNTHITRSIFVYFSEGAVLNNGFSFLYDEWMSHSEKWQEVPAYSFLIYHRIPECVHVFWGKGGLLVTSHSPPWQSTVMGGWVV